MTSDDFTLEQAKQWLRDRIDDGDHCPCCGQFAKVYKRAIHATMARALITMHLAAPAGEWFYLPDILKGRLNFGGDASKAVYWGLIEEDGETRDDGSTRTGWWRLTDQGRLYVLGQLKIPKYARIYDGRRLGFAGDLVDIHHAISAKFDYDKLMQGIA